MTGVIVIVYVTSVYHGTGLFTVGMDVVLVSSACAETEKLLSIMAHAMNAAHSFLPKWAKLFCFISISSLSCRWHPPSIYLYDRSNHAGNQALSADFT